jgi:urea transport system permease protein
MLKEPDITKLPMLEKALASEADGNAKALMLLARAAIMINSDKPEERLNAARALAQNQTPDTVLLLNQRLSQEDNKEVRNQIESSLRTIQSALGLGEKLGALFTGISLGSILLLVALGLAITYGLMSVINMAHGELMMIGAYATYVVQILFRQYLPAAFDWYLLIAVPISFMAAALVGAVLERLVLRHLYGRPLETLLATWGISLVLMQSVRSLFGAQNVGVENPSWMSGGLQVLSNLSLPYNRLVIIGFALFVLLGMALLISKTRLGLFVRGVTQNRPMASALGVHTARVDTYAFSLGCGIAGLAGCALSQIGNVGPDLGQNYIVDAFMVVVLGGVGQLAGDRLPCHHHRHPHRHAGGAAHVALPLPLQRSLRRLHGAAHCHPRDLHGRGAAAVLRQHRHDGLLRQPAVAAEPQQYRHCPCLLLLSLRGGGGALAPCRLQPAT